MGKKRETETLGSSEGPGRAHLSSLAAAASGRPWGAVPADGHAAPGKPAVSRTCRDIFLGAQAETDTDEKEKQRTACVGLRSIFPGREHGVLRNAY